MQWLHTCPTSETTGTLPGHPLQWLTYNRHTIYGCTAPHAIAIALYLGIYGYSIYGYSDSLVVAAVGFQQKGRIGRRGKETPA